MNNIRINFYLVVLNVKIADRIDNHCIVCNLHVYAEVLSIYNSSVTWSGIHFPSSIALISTTAVTYKLHNRAISSFQS